MSRQLEGSRRHDIQALLECGSCAGLSDRELLERFHEGRGPSAEMAFAVLVERLGPMVLRTCRAILRNAADAQDAFQVAFLVLSRKGRSIPPGTSAGGLVVWRRLPHVALREGGGRSTAKARACSGFRVA